MLLLLLIFLNISLLDIIVTSLPGTVLVSFAYISHILIIGPKKLITLLSFFTEPFYCSLLFLLCIAILLLLLLYNVKRYDFDDEMWLVLPVGNNNIIICLEFMAVVRVSIHGLLYFPRFGKTPVIL